MKLRPDELEDSSPSGLGFGTGAQLQGIHRNDDV
eukprot:CAMPEP_0206481942 /NCGR_PEP_ID=MMETSP0324_2-20121206/38509_1 /ASSEMBLY_ACC=CAM_ASM_000836 /TAXON_ID=2866 /ORGANISM="Crypthecodinium cohnii, Strain Seligo" /LENGTH=33 /DNA_ID= /DNA_START= /DNA_END= /DNA_ORIENTATION=